jgi:hypothetical protein
MAASLNANAQRCVNLFIEANPQETKPPAPTTHYPRPGKIYLSDPTVDAAGVLGPARGLYTASNGVLFAVVGEGVFLIDAAWKWFRLGTITIGTNPTSMADNGTDGNEIALVDGTANGYEIDRTTYAFSLIVDPTGLFTGADVVRYLSTFFMFNTIPNSQNWIISQPNSLTFDALDIAAKSSYPDNVSWLETRQRETWLLGDIKSSEPWNLAGAVDFPFDPVPGTYLPSGLLAKYSVVNTDNSIFWISRNADGKAIIVRSKGYDAERISNHAIESQLQGYDDITDAVGSCFQVQGHTFVVWSLPTANATIVYDVANKQWCEFSWTDQDGNLNRDRALFYQQAYGSTVALDWETGALYQIDENTFVDQVKRDGVLNEDAITCIRGFPHIVEGLDRLTINGIRVNMECGTIEDPNADPQLNLRISKDAGHTFSVVRQQPMGKTGKYRTTITFTRLGQARDWVLEFFWTVKAKTALLGAYLTDVEAAES